MVKAGSSFDKAANRPWELDIPPFCVAPHIHYVGNSWVGAYLLETSEGLGLIDTTPFESLYLLLESIRSLGYDPKDIRKLFLSHAHFDHDGGARSLKEKYGTEIYLSREDDEWRKKPEADLGLGFKTMDYEVDHYYDEKPIRMGEMVITPRLTPGHTPGCTSFFIQTRDEEGKEYVWAMHGGVGTNTLSTEYLQGVGLSLSLQERFLEDCEEMKGIPVDIAVSSHPKHGNLLERKGEDNTDFRPFVDPTCWARFLEERAEALRKILP